MLLKKKSVKSIICFILVLLMILSCCPITVGASSITITNIDVEPISIIEGTSGEYTSDYNWETDEYSDPYYWYNPDEQMEYTVTFSDGGTVSMTGNGFDYNDEWYYLYTNTDQSYENQWLAGNEYTMTVWYDDFSGVDVPVTIEETPVEKIEIAPLSVVTNTTGYISSAYNEETDDYDLEYFYYDLEDELEYTIYFKDGTEISGKGYEIEYNDKWYDIELETNQSYYNQWTAGNKYTLTASFMGHSQIVDVSILSTPFKSIEIEPISIMPGTNNSISIKYNSETERFDLCNYFYYPERIMEYTITLFDDSTITGVGEEFEYNGESYQFEVETDQLENPWEAGNDYTMEVSALGYSTTVPVTIEECPIESVEVQPIVIYEGTEGEYKSYDEWGEEVPEYYYYEPENLIEYTVTFKNGEKDYCTGNYLEYNDNYYYVYDFYYQDYDYQWTAGNEYKIQLFPLGYYAETTVKIEKSPVKEIIVEPMTLYQYVDSYSTRDCNPDTGEWDVEYENYDYYNDLEYKIVWTDGTVTEHKYNDNIEVNGKEYYMKHQDDQSYLNQWKPDNTYYPTLTFMGKSVEVPVKIEESPVKSVEMIKTPDKTEYELNEYIDLAGTHLRVTYKDGTYEDVKIKEEDYNNYVFYLEYFKKKYSFGMSAGLATSNTKEVTLNFLGHDLGHDVTFDISISEKVAEKLSISSSGYDLKLTIDYADGSQKTLNAICFDEYRTIPQGDCFAITGQLWTDSGNFYATLYENVKSGEFYFGLNQLTSNSLSQDECKWWQVIQKTEMYSLHLGEAISEVDTYDGNVTSENIDGLMSIACSVKGFDENSSQCAGKTATGYLIYEDSAKAAFMASYGITPDLNLSNKYDAENGVIEVKSHYLYGPFYGYPIRLKQTEDGVEASVTYNRNGIKYQNIIYDKDLKVIGFNYEKESDVLVGDANLDGILNILDATAVQKHLAGIEKLGETAIKAADYNGDGIVSIIDATDIQKKIAGII